MKTSCGKFLNLAHYFRYDVELRLLANSRSFLANQKARNAIVGAENLLKLNSTRYGVYHLLKNSDPGGFVKLMKKGFFVMRL